MAEVINVGKNAKDVRRSTPLLPYSKVIINVSKTSSDEVVSYIAGDDTGNTLEFDCPWGTQEMADKLYQKLIGYQYQPYTVTSAIVNPAAEMGDAVQTNGVYGGIYQQDTQFGHTIYTDFAAPQDEQLDHEFTFESPIERRLSRQEAYAKSTFQIQHDNIEARVARQSGTMEEESFSWRLLSDEFGLYSGSRKVFTCNKDGITIKGTIYADSGLIGAKYNSQTGEWSGGFHIAEKKMWSGQSTYNGIGEDDVAGVYIGTDGIGLGLSNFTVTKAGVLSAKSGTIGSDENPADRWQIGGRSIHKGTDNITSTTPGVYVGTDGFRAYKEATKNVTLKADGTTAICAGMIGVDDVTNTTGMFIGNEGISLGGGKFQAKKDGTVRLTTGYVGSTWDSTNKKWNDDGFLLTGKKLYSGTSSLTSTDSGVYLGTDGIRTYREAGKGCTFKASGDFEIMHGLTAHTDIGDGKTGVYMSPDGITLGGGRFQATKTGDVRLTTGHVGSTWNSEEKKWNSDGFEIAKKKMFNGTASLDSVIAGIYLGTDGIRVYKEAGKGCTFKASGDFEIMHGLTGHNDIGNGKTGMYIDPEGITLGGGKFVAAKNGIVRFSAGYIGSTWNDEEKKWNSDGFHVKNKSIYNGTTSLASTDAGVYVGTDGIRTYKEAGKGCTFKASGDFEIMHGLTGHTDIGDGRTGIYINNQGITLGGGKFYAGSDGTMRFSTGYIGSTWDSINKKWNDDGFIISSRKIYKGTDSLTSTTSGVYLGVDGIRSYKEAGKAFTFKADGTFEIMNGLTSHADLGTSKSGLYINQEGITIGGGKFVVSKTGAMRFVKGYIGSTFNEDTKLWNDDGFVVMTKKMYNNTDSLTSTNAGVYLGTDGIRVFKQSGMGCTFKADGTFEIMHGLTSHSDLGESKDGLYINPEGITIGGGKFVASKGGVVRFSRGYIGSTWNENTKAWNSDGFIVKDLRMYRGTDSLTSTTPGVYLATDGIRVYKEAGKACTFKADGTFEIMNGLASHTDIGDSKTGVYINNAGITLGGGKFYAGNNGSVRFTTGYIGSTWNSSSKTWNTDGFLVSAKKIYNNTDSLTSTKAGVYLGTDGIRAYKESGKGFTFKADGTFEIMNGLTAHTDLGDGKNGLYINQEGITIGGGKFTVSKGGVLRFARGYVGSTWNSSTKAWNSDGFIVKDLRLYRGTDSLTSTTSGVYLGTDGIRVYNKSTDSKVADKGFTFKANGTLEILGGLTSVDDTTHSSGMYMGNSGIALGGGKFKVTSGGALTAKNGEIAGWTIGTSALSKLKKTGNIVDSHVGISTSGSYCFYAGESDEASNCAFRVTDKGKVYLTKLYCQEVDTTAEGYNEDDPSTWTWVAKEVDLYSNAYKISGNNATITSVGSDGKVRLSNGKTFSTAASTYLTANWSGGTSPYVGNSYGAAVFSINTPTKSGLKSNTLYIVEDYENKRMSVSSTLFGEGDDAYKYMSLNKTWTMGTYKGASSVSIDVSWDNELPYTDEPTNKLTVTTKGKKKEDGTDNEESHKFPLKLTVGSWPSSITSSSTCNVTLSSGDMNAARATVSASSPYKAGQDSVSISKMWRDGNKVYARLSTISTGSSSSMSLTTHSNCAQGLTRYNGGSKIKLYYKSGNTYYETSSEERFWYYRTSSQGAQELTDYYT